MADTTNTVTKLAQTSITQFFSVVNEAEVSSQRIPHPYVEEGTETELIGSHEEVDRADLEIRPDAEVHNPIQNTPTAKRAGINSKGLNIRVFQLNTGKRVCAGSALARLMGASNHSLALITEPPFYQGKVCGFSGATFNSIYHSGTNKRCRAAIIASSGIELCPLAAYTDEDTASALAFINGRLTCIVSSYMDGTVNCIPEMLHKSLSLCGCKQVRPLDLHR